MRTEISPGKIGDGLFAITSKQDRNASEDGLSSEEENLIAQSTFEIRNILVHKQVTSTLMSRFVEASDSMLSEG